MATDFPSILIIYNPTSTSGKAETRAIRLAKQLERRKFVNVKLRKSEFPGHSEVLAYNETCEHKNPLIISVSGDGGYNEVINGAIRAQNSDETCQPVCAILAAGNANDHRRAVAKRSILRAIIDSKPELMDVLCLRFGNSERFAHSYIGVGITAETAAALNSESLSRWKEVKIITRNLLNFRRMSIKIDGKFREIDSIVCANIHRMAKVMKLNDKTNLHDGLFNLILMPHRSRLKFFYLLLKIIIFGVKNPPQLDRFEFELAKVQLAQLDGEPLALPARTNISITLEPERVRTLL